MTKVLFIQTSMTGVLPRGSVSTLVLKTFYNFYKKNNPAHYLKWLNLNNVDIAQETLNDHNFFYFFKNPQNDYYINELKNFNKLVISVPMINFNYPGVLKNFLDHILIAKKTFLYKYDGKGTSEGLVKNLKVQIITTQGAHLGWYLFANHTQNLIGTFKFMGCKLTEPLIIAGTKAHDNIQKTAQEIVDENLKTIKNYVQKF